MNCSGRRCRSGGWPRWPCWPASRQSPPSSASRAERRPSPWPMPRSSSRSCHGHASPPGAGRPGRSRPWVDLVEAELRRRSIPGTCRRSTTPGAWCCWPAARPAAQGGAGGGRPRLGRLSRVWEGTWVRLDLAACLLRTDRPAEAISLVEDVRSIADRLGSRPLATRASELLREARARHPSDEPWSPADRARVRGRPAHRGRPDQRRDRRQPVHRPQDGELARRAHPGQARAPRAGPRSRPGHRPSQDRTDGRHSRQ